MIAYDASLLGSDTHGRRRLGALPGEIQGADDREIVVRLAHTGDGITRADISVERDEAANPASTRQSVDTWTYRLWHRNDLVGFARLCAFRSAGPELDATLLGLMDRHSPDACALFLMVKRHFITALPSHGSLVMLSSLQILPDHQRSQGWITAFERCLARTPFTHPPAILAGIPYPLEYSWGPDCSFTPAFQRRQAALVRFYQRRLGFHALQDVDDIWIWRPLSLQGRAATDAGLILRSQPLSADALDGLWAQLRHKIPGA